MTINSADPRLILSAVRRIYNILPALVGADWQTIQPQVDEYITALENQPDHYLVSTQLFGLLARYAPARERLTQELNVQKAIADNIQPALDKMQFTMDEGAIATIMSGLSWEVDSDSVPRSEETVKGITLNDGGVNGGKSVKFKNLDLDLNKMMTIGGGFLLSAHDMIDKPSPFLVTAGLLVMIGTLLDEMTVKIAEQEATVFWGFITATHDTPKNRQASLETIIISTNAERTKRGLGELTDAQITNSLQQLVLLGSIARTRDNTYQIIENFKVKK